MFDRFFKTALGLAVAGVLGVSVWAQAPAQPKAKDQGEYDLTAQIQKETDPQKKLDLLKQWEQKYPDSEFKNTRVLMEAQTLNQMAVAGYGKTDPAILDSSDKASKEILQNLDKFFDPSVKPPNVSDADWQKAKQTFALQANTMVGYVAMTKKDDTAAEAAFKKALELDPGQAQISYWLGTVILRQAAAQKKPEMYPEALYEIARATVVTGPGALQPAAKKPAEDYLAKAYAGYHGDASGLDDVKKTAGTSALMPAEFKIKSVTDIANEAAANEEQFKKQFPDLFLWRQIRDALKADPNYMDQLKDVGFPPADAGFAMLKAKVVSQPSPKELLVNVDNAPSGDALLQFDSPLKGTIDPDTPMQFKGVINSYKPDPYQLVFTIDDPKEDIEGLPATVFAPAAATKKGGKKAPKALPKKK